MGSTTAAEPDIANSKVDWSGFYAGIFGGYSLDTGKDIDFGVAGRISRISTAFGGARVGYLHQQGPIVLGAETALALGDFNRYADVPANVAGSTGTSWIATVEGKLGVAIDDWLLYGHAGLALADIAESFSLPFPIAVRQTQVGAVVGAGTEFRLSDTISAGVDYSYISMKPISDGLFENIGTYNGIHTIRAGLNFHF